VKPNFLNPGDEVLCYETEIKEFVETHFRTVMQYQRANTNAYLLLASLTNPSISNEK